MSKLRSRAKMNGLVVLRGSWIKAIVILSILELLFFGLQKLVEAYRNVFNVPNIINESKFNTSLYSILISIIALAILFVIMTPLLLGMKEWYWNLTSDNKTGIGDVFSWYGSVKQYFKSLLLGINIGIRMFLWSLLIIGLPVAMIGYSIFLSSKIDITQTSRIISKEESIIALQITLLSIFGLILLAGGLFLLLYICSKYTIACYLIVEDNTRKIRDVVRNSILYTREYRWEITKFYLSFLGWALFCLAIVPSIFVVPYFNSSFALFAKHIILTKRPKYQNGDTVQYSTNNSGLTK